MSGVEVCATSDAFANVEDRAGPQGAHERAARPGADGPLIPMLRGSAVGEELEPIRAELPVELREEVLGSPKASLCAMVVEGWLARAAAARPEQLSG